MDKMRINISSLRIEVAMSHTFLIVVFEAENVTQFSVQAKILSETGLDKFISFFSSSLSFFSLSHVRFSLVFVLFVT